MFKDPSDLAASRIIYQYQNSENFKRMISVLPTIAEDSILPAAVDAINLINIEAASGEKLDIIGRIVGIERPTIGSNQLAVFAYNGTPSAQPYGVAPYIGPGESIPSIPIPDYLYRVVIRAKIVKNNSRATIDDLRQGFRFILGPGYTTTIIDRQDMTVRVILNREPSFNVRTLLDNYDLMPRPQGVRIEYVTSMPNQDTPGSFAGSMLGGDIF